MRIINLWSGPRNVSTALMYSFSRRGDTKVVDEPLYGHYLSNSRARHPGGEDVMRQMNCDGDAVMRSLLGDDANGKDILFIKHMAHHLVQLDLSFLDRTHNALLIRDPAEMLPSLTVQVPQAGLDDTGLKRQWELFEDLQERGQMPAVLDSRELLLNPHGVISSFCDHLDIRFDDNMLTWPPGPIAEDGVWASHWYHTVHKSTGFAKYVAKYDFPDNLRALLEQCQPYYDKLYSRAIKSPRAED